MKLKLLILFFSLSIISCSTSPQYQVQKLPSGKEIKIISLVKTFFLKDKPALALKYQTDININDDNIELLRKEAEEIWPIFRVDVEKSEYKIGIITAASKPTRKFFILSSGTQYNFVTKRNVNGTWDLSSWKRDYDSEMRTTAEEYVKNSINADTKNLLKSFHYPGNFTEQQLQEEQRGISTILNILAEHFGSISTYNLNNTPIKFGHFVLQSASQEYWSKHPRLCSLIYDVNFSKIGNGYLIFSFSMVQDELVVNAIQYCIPDNNPQKEAIINEIAKDVTNKLNNT